MMTRGHTRTSLFFLVIGLLALGMSSISVFLSPQISMASVRDSHPYGITIEAKDPRLWTDQNAGEMQAAGISWTRLQIHWKKDETSPNVYNWAQDDEQIALAQKYGLLVDWALQAPPTWDIQPGCQQMFQGAPMAQYAVAVFKRYGSAIKAFEVGNEEPSFDHTLACRSASLYAQALATVAKALRTAGFVGLIGMFGYTNYDTLEQVSSWFTAFNNDPSHAANLINYYNFHFYHEGQDPNLALKGKPALLDVVGAIHLAAVGHGQKPIWLTETGYRTHCDALHPYPCNAVTPEQQAQYEHEIFEDGRLSGGILDHVFLYTLCPGTQVMSIVQNGVPLPAYDMLKQEIAAYPSWTR